jgi:putative endonuclease
MVSTPWCGSVHDSVEAAIRREKQIKEWKRKWKFHMIERNNPHWIDLYCDLAL